MIASDGVFAASVAVMVLFVGLSFPLSAYAATTDEEWPAPASSMGKKRREGLPVFNVDDLRVEWGGFIDDAAPISAVLFHGAISVKGQVDAGLEYALGVRLDGYSQSGGQKYTDTTLDYTENYLRWRNADMRFTLGTQNILWGRVDETPPVDRLSRVDLSRFVLDKLPERRRAVPAVRFERFLGDYKLDAAWVPVFTPAVVPDTRSIWHMVNQTSGRILGVAGIPTGLVQNASLIEGKEDGGGGGLRLTRAGGRLDYGLSFQYARQSVPYYRLTALGPTPIFTSVHPYSWILGGEMETQIAGATWRLESAWSSDIPVTTWATSRYRTEPAADLIIGVEFFPGDSDTRVTLQLAGHKTYVGEAVFDRTEIVAFNGEIEHPFAHGRWRANLRFMAGVNERDVYLSPKITYFGLDQHEFYLAAHIFSGAEGTLGGFHRQHDLVTVGWQARF